MIKIEPAKNFTASQSGSSKTNLASSESENRDGMGNEAQGSSDFASVLENLTSKDWQAVYDQSRQQSPIGNAENKISAALSFVAYAGTIFAFRTC